MKKHYIIIGLNVFLLLVSFSCGDDFLEKKPQGITTQESFPTNPDDALLATNAVYSTLRNWSYHSGGFPILDVMSDDAFKGSSKNDGLPNVGVFDTFIHTADVAGLNNWWSSLYEGIKRANVVVEFVPQVEFDNNLRNRYVAEARLLRGLYYFDLTRAWGEVPLVLTTTPPRDEQKSSTDEIYSAIDADLKFALEHLEEKSQLSPSDLGRVTKGAARALLARVALFKGDFISAEKYALEVINSDQYDLEPVYAHANSIEGENGVESVLEIGALQITDAGNGGNQYANTQGVRGAPNKGWGFNRPSVDLREAFEDDDPRQDATIIEIGEVIDGIEIIGIGEEPFDNGYATEIEAYNQKVWVPGSTTVSNFGHNRRLIRYADVLLMAAEALNENNKPGEALIYLNRVRERAREGNTEILPDITETDQSALREIIYHERRVELALEGHRFWDLVRTNRAGDLLAPMGFVEGKHELFPVPLNQIDLSKGSLTQNDNWN